MASGQTLITLFPHDAEAPAANPATEIRRNGQPVLEFDAATQEIAIFTAILPREYGGGGLTVIPHWQAASAVTGTGGWDVAFEKSAGIDTDSDNFASAQTITAVTVPATAGEEITSSVAIANGANMASIVGGDKFRLRIRRDVANDNAAGDLQLKAIEIKET